MPKKPIFFIPRRIAVDLAAHVFVTLILSFLIYFKTGNLSYLIIFVISGIFIDLDHLIDYFIVFKNKFNFYKFINCHYLKSGKVYIFLHSWEPVFFFLILGYFVKSPGLVISLTSIIIHLIIDNLQRRNISVYFLTYRIIKKFDTGVLLPELKLFIEQL